MGLLLHYYFGEEFSKIFFWDYQAQIPLSLTLLTRGVYFRALSNYQLFTKASAQTTRNEGTLNGPGLRETCACEETSFK